MGASHTGRGMPLSLSLSPHTPSPLRLDELDFNGPVFVFNLRSKGQLAPALTREPLKGLSIEPRPCDDRPRLTLLV